MKPNLSRQNLSGFLHIGLSLLSLAGAAALSAPAQAALFERATNDLQAEAQAAGREGKRLAVLLTLPDCPGCRDMEAKVYRDEALEKSFAGKFRNVRLDISQTSSLIDPAGQPSTPARLASRLRAIGTPAFLFFDAQGNVLYRHLGTLDRDGFRQLADYVDREEYERRPFQADISASPARTALQAERRRAAHPHDSHGAHDHKHQP